MPANPPRGTMYEQQRNLPGANFRVVARNAHQQFRSYDHAHLEGWARIRDRDPSSSNAFNGYRGGFASYLFIDALRPWLQERNNMVQDGIRSLSERLWEFWQRNFDTPQYQNGNREEREYFAMAQSIHRLRNALQEMADDLSLGRVLGDDPALRGPRMAPTDPHYQVPPSRVYNDGDPGPSTPRPQAFPRREGEHSSEEDYQHGSDESMREDSQ